MTRSRLSTMRSADPPSHGGAGARRVHPVTIGCFVAMAVAFGFLLALRLTDHCGLGTAIALSWIMPVALAVICAVAGWVTPPRPWVPLVGFLATIVGVLTPLLAWTSEIDANGEVLARHFDLMAMLTDGQFWFFVLWYAVACFVPWAVVVAIRATVRSRRR